MGIWRKIKKYYFKIYHFLKLIGIFLIFFLPNIVKAEECTNLLADKQWSFTKSGTWSYYIMNNIKFENGKKYTFYGIKNGELTQDIAMKDPYANERFWNINGYTYRFGDNLSVTINNTKTTTNNGSIMTSWQEGGKITDQYFLDRLQNIEIWLVEGENVCIPTPPEPPKPESSQIYDDFLTIYVDRFNYLGNGLLENPYLFIFAGIIFSFVVLEIFLHILHIRGGYKK